MKKVLIISGIVVVAGVAGFYFYNKMPKAVININDASEAGTIEIGSKSGTFTKTMAPSMRTWNGWELNMTSGGGYMLRHNGKVYASATAITPYDNGSSYVTINHV